MKLKHTVRPQMKSLFVIYGLLLAVFLIMVVISPTYRSAENIGNIIVQCVPLAVVSLGQTVVMIGGGIDMSVGSLISLSTCIAAVVMKPGTGLSLALGILAVFLVAGIVGLCNGIGANYAKVPPLITTLSMMILLSGVAQGVLPVAGGKVNTGFAKVMMARAGIFSVSILILLIVYLIIRRFMYRTPTGVSVYAIGNNADIAASMGVRAKRVSVLTYVIAALCAAVTGPAVGQPDTDRRSPGGHHLRSGLHHCRRHWRHSPHRRRGHGGGQHRRSLSYRNALQYDEHSGYQSFLSIRTKGTSAGGRHDHLLPLVHGGGEEA